MFLIAAGRQNSVEAFLALTDLVREWRSLGRTTTTAGLKPALQQALPGFSESELGFSAFRDFVSAAAEADYVKIFKSVTGHSIVLLPGEQPEDVTQREAAARIDSGTPTRNDSAPVTVGRLKHDVWSSFVTWYDSHSRLWDRDNQRSFVFPVDENGDPAWTDDTPHRFVQIPAVDQPTQIEWMREWAQKVPSPDRDVLVGALEPGVPLGQFRRELQAAGLATSWRAELQRRVGAHVAEWSRAHDIPLHQLLDHRPPPRPASSPSRSSITLPAGRHNPNPPPAPVPTDDTTRLRLLLHRAIDRMSLPELLTLPVRAEHLLDR